MKPKKLLAVATTATVLTSGTLLVPRITAKANPLAIPAVSACAASVVCAVGTVVIGGILYYTLSRPGQPVQYFPAHQGPYPDNPDEPSEGEWTEDLGNVFAAPSLKAAQEACNRLAKAKSIEYGTKVTAVAVPTRTSYYFRCRLTVRS